MEIVVQKLSYKDFSNLNFIIPDGKITGITGKGKTTILKLLNGLVQGKGTIKYNNKRITIKTKLSITKRVIYIDSTFKNQFLASTVIEHMISFMRYYKLNIKDPQKKLEDSLKIVGLSNAYLTRNITTLSASEKKQLQIATALLTNPELLLLDEPFISLDNKNEKKLVRLLGQLNDRFHINIVIASNNSEILYKYTNKMILIKDYKILKEGFTKDIYEDVQFMIDNDFEIPDIVLFAYKAKTMKEAKINYHRDLRDLIKDIYKHV